MSTNKEIVQAYYKSMATGTPQGFKFAGNLKFTGPLAQTNTAQDFAALVQQMMPMTKSMKIIDHVVEGDRAFSLWEWETNTPAGTVRGSERLLIKNGEIAEIEIHYDPRPLVEVMGKA